ncbi:hypothetical protein Theba_1793 [Mesotoga prima MesG1.Ag.4.2]|jgi:hypothetical protein|uniref:Uncharacterized protein n=1 Tax=Mesotoga prima MesG1.Ag.4.2 TaxID=660470 RepID=I2F691_9BACT|nr:hypothetical protein [Mesotoga prima]AFK07444.1 hypothetical protein Theba_1793 [Mesotoga prima MesG1.Ag.4.2]MCP5457605.1 hypothetical protein [Thermotogota bacterium]HNQ71451.1 hypothetical protein [Mesotoga prima]
MAFKDYHIISLIMTIVFVTFYGTLLAGIGDSEESNIPIIKQNQLRTTLEGPTCGESFDRLYMALLFIRS